MTAQILQDVSRAALRLAASYPDDDLGNPKDALDDLIYIILSGQTNEGLYQTTYRALKTAFPRWGRNGVSAFYFMRNLFQPLLQVTARRDVPRGKGRSRFPGGKS